MDVDFATFLTTVYVEIDTWCAERPPVPPPHPGPPRHMRDSEVLTLMLIGQWRGVSERGLLRWAADQLSDAFPDLLSQSAFNRRARALAGQAVQLMQDLATRLDVAADAYEIVDCVPVPVAQRCRGDRHRRFTPEEANVGRGGVGKAFYYGVSLLLSVAASGPITGFVVAPANVEGRWLLSSLLSWRQDPTAVPMTEAALNTRNAKPRPYVGPTGDLLGPTSAGATVTGVYLADQGFKGAVWQAHWREDLQATVWTHEQLPSPLRHWFHAARQTIEIINGQLTDVFHSKFPRAHTQAGLMTRIAAKCAALNLGILINQRLGRPALALGTLFTG